ncbi:MAG: hypothetical protein K5656_01850 [Lachnospiraceae bacterium]|nr:hypothetical protein [Lachnospiraceae bacterium]
MNKEDINKLVDIFRDMFRNCNCGYGMSVATMRGYLEPLTKALKLNKDKNWQTLCFDWNDNAAQEYLKLKPVDLLRYNGMSLVNWDEKDINKRVIDMAINARKHELTPTAIYNTRKIRSKLSNAYFVQLAENNHLHWHDTKNNLYELVNHYWLKCMNKKDKSLAEIKHLKSFNDWVNYLDCVHFFIERTEYKRFDHYIDIVKSLNPPKDVISYITELRNFALRYQTVNHEIGYGKKVAVPLVLDKAENEEFETYLKIKGIDWHKEYKTEFRMDQHYEDNLLGLNECLLAKYNNNLRKETI